ncbi:CE1759 family FMN reductase [Cellulomonas bogoriensis]|uniref:NADPH-dependent FMN reductase n=1 Tax=Cellulomonas bogoriensis 69B4 = DSM 16987 TaxID=1386082 RepID=A0A0A0BLN6_9CELL|nr:CE1759 family FMN reductase [Cellulomonas bogoriensis]KGM08876.1 NADPH-dependent FMN reductase [Cellulomonas bogoriensis 69B4 = DSM 16987]
MSTTLRHPGGEGDREGAVRVAVVSAGLRQPSSTQLLADRLAEGTRDALGDRDLQVHVTQVGLRTHAQDLTNMLLTGFAPPDLQTAIDHVVDADALIAVSPIFSGSYNGLFKSFFDVLDEDVLAGVPVLLAATAGTARHSLAIDHAMRPLFAYLNALALPTGVFAATDDFGSSSGVREDDVVAPLADRVRRATQELAEVVASRPRRAAHDPMALTASFEEMLRGRS